MPDTAQTILHGAATYSSVLGTSGSALLRPCKLDGLLGGVPMPAAAAAMVMAWRLRQK